MSDLQTLYPTNEERLNFIKGLVRVARSDTKITSEEEIFFINASKSVGLEDSQIQDLKQALVDSSILLPLSFSNKEQSVFLLKEAIQLCFIDGHYAESEKEEIYHIAKDIDVPLSAVVALEEWVQEGMKWTQRGDALLMQLSGE